MGTMVTVHGAGDGGWAWTPVAERLRRAGHQVFRCTLTGYGERRHLASPTVTLETHIQDVLNLIQYEDLHDVWLVGHSYGGMVTTAVAERIPERLAHLVYVDAMVPANGERFRDLPSVPQAVALVEQQLGHDAWLWPRNAALPERYGPVLAKPFNDPVTVTSPLAARLPRTYIAFTERDLSNPAYVAVAAVAARVQEWGWPIIALPYDHNGHQSHPDEVAAVLHQLMAGQAIVEPSEAGPLQVGTVMRMPADSTTQPGAFSVTWIETATATEQEAVSRLTREILGDLQRAPGFLGWTGGTVGRRQFTVTAWARPEDAEAAMARGAHRKAVQAFFEPAFQGAAWTSVWVPHRLNPLWVLCTACSTLRRAAQGTVCECGAPLPTFPYW